MAHPLSKVYPDGLTVAKLITEISHLRKALRDAKAALYESRETTYAILSAALKK